MTTIKDPYQDIRPYNDDEVPEALNRLILDDEFIQVIIQYRIPNCSKALMWVLKPLLKVWLKSKWSNIQTVDNVQQHVASYMESTLKKTSDGVSFSGLEQLDPSQSYLFVSNHRDIAMDPAVVNWGLHQRGLNTLRIAIGDNLLKKPCATELMRLNKSFIVKRSAKGPREMMKVLGQLSGYIKHSLETGNSIWIAQKEGRAKDGNDKTDPAILKMFHVEGRKRKLSFCDYVKELNIVPVSISYENDPCDVAKAKELHQIEHSGSYEKGEFEDIESIVQGIIGQKGRVHVSFGDVIKQDFENPEALATEIDRQIHKNYKLFPINFLAADENHASVSDKAKVELENKLAQLPKAAHPILIGMYANPVLNQH